LIFIKRNCCKVRYALPVFSGEKNMFCELICCQAGGLGKCFSRLLFVFVTTLAYTNCSAEVQLPADIKGSEEAILTNAPEVPPVITRDHPTKVVVHLEVREVEKRLADGVTYVFWTFGGSVPGKFIRVREGDFVEMHLSNHQDSKMPHNIDLHAVTGPGGGATSSFTAPGHSSVFSFRAINAGLYVYHCATAPVGMHVANGMYGLIYVQPKVALPPVDHEYYVMQGEFYTKGRYGEEGQQPFDMERAVDERPAYVVFNGEVGSLVGTRALTAKTNQKVRLFIGNGGPNLVSSFHVIGEIFDDLYQEGGTLVSQRNVQTTLVPAGGSAIADFHTEVPGTYVLVDHSIFRAFNKGALGMLKIEGPEDKIIYSGKEVDETYIGEAAPGAAAAAEKISDLKAKVKEAEKASPKLVALNTELQVERGKRVFSQACAMCHQAEGQGMEGVFPPVAGSEIVTGDAKRVVAIVLHGLNGPVKVKGKDYNGVMPPQSLLSDEQVADVATYIRNSWGNKASAVSSTDVTAVRNERALQ